LRCKESQISILPKNLVSNFEFLVNHEQTKTYDAVHIDDDKYIRALWLKCAVDQKLKILSLGKFDEIFKHLKNFNESTPIYIDSDLGNGSKGEILAKSLHDEGFINLHISTGFSESDFNKPDYIRSVIGKDPPWS
jgi:hypothetical protein